MGKKETCLMRVDRNFAKLLKEVPINRIRNGSENVKISDREVTRMSMSTSEFHNMLKKLSTEPRKQT